jgi:hypothetical protein
MEEDLRERLFGRHELLGLYSGERLEEVARVFLPRAYFGYKADTWAHDFSVRLVSG